MSDLITERRAEYAGFGTRELVLAGDGAPLVLLHGYSHTADVWRPVLSRLAAAGHAAVAVDVPGFGAADRLADGPVMPQMDKFVRGVVEHWAGSGQVTLVGNSMGGALTVRAACTPDLPIAAAMPIDLAGFGLRRSLTRLIGLPDRLVPLLRFPLPRPVFDRIVYQAAKRATYAHGSTADPAMVRLVNGFIPDRDAALPALELGRAVVHESEHDFLADLSPSAVHCPMTIVHGTKDRLVPVAASRRLHELVPGSTLVVLPGVGHCPQLDVPGEVTRLALNLRP
ncbi:alpha/beta hydrolase [Speluncibacter jeojiensis]|uniref:Alpha/beta hydrolase n=1 Tax=Speluncibacter jeojiensis TaxID=2710754 RepID=A0A9X4RF32_9ACTN|nr:alpha/beta hydrolase [Corynebacteriales bacterium D3-21]